MFIPQKTNNPKKATWHHHYLSQASKQIELILTMFTAPSQLNTNVSFTPERERAHAHAHARARAHARTHARTHTHTHTHTLTHARTHTLTHMTMDICLRFCFSSFRSHSLTPLKLKHNNTSAALEISNKVRMGM